MARTGLKSRHGFWRRELCQCDGTWRHAPGACFGASGSVACHSAFPLIRPLCVRGLQNGTIDIGMVARDLRDSEVKALGEPMQRVFARDADARSQVTVADSTRRCNSFLKSLSGCFVLKRLSRSFVEAPSDRVELGLRIPCEIDALGQILSQ